MTLTVKVVIAGVLLSALSVAFAVLRVEVRRHRRTTPLASVPVTPEPLHTPQPPVHDITTKPARRPDGAHHVLAALVERDAPTEYLPRHGGARCGY